MKKVLLRGGHFGECIVDFLDDDIGGVIIKAHYSEIEQAVTFKETEDIIYTDTGRIENISEDEFGWESARLFEVDFQIMRNSAQYEMVMT